ncbi:MAG: hypothetical protein WA091_01460 [Minisyncoccales bacterium]
MWAQLGVIVINKVETEEPMLKVAMPVPNSSVALLKGKGVAIREMKSGHFAYFTPDKWFFDKIGLVMKSRVTIPYALINQDAFLNINECIRLSENGRLQELQTICRDSGEDFKPLCSFWGNDQDRPKSIVFDIISTYYKSKIIIIKSELIGGNYVLSIVGLKAERVNENQIMLTARWLYESQLKSEKGRLRTIVAMPESMEVYYGEAVHSHLVHLKNNAKILQGEVLLDSAAKGIKLGVVSEA